MPNTLYLDADACPVKAESYKVAERHGWPVKVVANDWMGVPRIDWVELVVVGKEFDAADDWIAERAGPGDVVVTGDIPLADRCVKSGATVLGHNGRRFDEASIGMALATRDLMDNLRASPVTEVTGGPPPFSQKDRSAYLSALHEAIEKIERGG